MRSELMMREAAMLSVLALTRRRLLCGTTLMLALGPWPASAAKDPTHTLLIRLCDIVIPDSDTPGATAAGVPAFLAMALPHQVFGGDAKTLPGLLRHLDARAGDGGFMTATAARQLEIVTALDHATFARLPPPTVPLPTQGSTEPQPSIAAPVDNESQRLWRIVKSGIVTSFYTTKSGGSRTLAYELVPGRYDADVALHADPYLSNFWIENVF